MAITASTQRRYGGIHIFWGIFFIAVGFASIATTRLDIAIILPEVMKGIGVVSLAAGGLISTLTVLGTDIAEPFLGRLSEVVSRRLVLALGLGLFALFSLFTATAANLPSTANLPSMIVVRILLGVGQGMFIPAYFAFLGGAFSRRRGFVLGSLAGLFTVGAAINPLTTRAIFSAAGNAWRAPFIAYGVFGLVLAALVYLLGGGGLFEMGRHHAAEATAESEAQATAEGKTGIFSRSMLLLLAVMVCWGLTQYGYLGLFVTFLRTRQHFTPGAAGVVASVAGWTSFVFSFVGGWLSDHIGRRKSLLIFGVVGL
ncbi:MAG TPA: MFS transporter, partial [Chloroflexota bacterium]|nr:MFS transporter [Chloroflexota bacterium]